MTSSVSSKPTHGKKAIEGPQLRSKAVHGAEGDLATVAGADGDRGQPIEIEIVALSQIGLDDPPCADERVIADGGHVGVTLARGSLTKSSVS